jgi:hypothetical protein
MPLAVTVPEGLRSEEVALLMEREGIVTADDFRRALSSGEYDFAFLSERPAGVGLEGYLFPATYGFSRGVTAEEVVQRMLAAFDEQVTPELRQAAQASGLTLHEASPWPPSSSARLCGPMSGPSSPACSSTGWRWAWRWTPTPPFSTPWPTTLGASSDSDSGSRA